MGTPTAPGAGNAAPPAISARRVALPVAALLLAACASAGQSASGILEIQVDASATGRGGNVPAASPAPRQPPRRAGWRFEVLGADGATAALLVTDDQGLARIALPTGDYRLRLVAPPGEATVHAVSVPSGGTMHILVHLHDPTP